MKMLLTMFALIVSFVGCDLGTQKSNEGVIINGSSNKLIQQLGVGQGNGMTAGLYLAGYQFGMSYSKDLVLIKHNEQKFEVNNSTLTQNKNVVSKLDIEIIEDSMINSVQDLDDVALANFPSKDFNSIKYNDFSGISSEEKTDDTIQRVDYLFISNGIYIQATTAAFANGDGIKKIEPVIKTITSDHTPPFIFNLKLSKEKFIPGDDLILELEGIDNVSGIDQGCCAAIFLKEQPNNVFKDSDAVNGVVKKINDTKFGLSNFPINKYAEAGVYTIEKFFVQDVAGNQAVLEINSEDPRFYKLNGSINTKIKVLKFEIVSSYQGDIEYPTISKLSLKNNTLQAGDDLVIEFTAEDNISGIELGCCSGVSLGETPHNVFKASDSSNGQVVSLGGRQYQVTNLHINQYAKAGKYTIDRFSIHDNAGNEAILEINPNNFSFYRYGDGTETDLMVLNFKIIENKQEDLKAPEIKSLSLAKEEFTPGEDMVLVFEAEDDISGIEIGCCSAVFLKEYPNNVFRNSDGVNGIIETIKDGKFMITNLRINDYADHGEYTISRFFIFDNAGNKTILEIDPDNNSFYRYENGVKTGIKLLTFKVK